MKNLLIVASLIGISISSCLPPRKTVATERDPSEANIPLPSELPDPANVERSDGLDAQAATTTGRDLGDLEELFSTWLNASETATGGKLGFALVHIESKTRFYYKADIIVNSAAAAQWLWAAAALTQNSAGSLQQYAEPTFRQGSSEMAGRLIDFAGGISSVNRFGEGIGLNQSAWSLCRWSFSSSGSDPACNTANSGSNFFTARAGLIFLEKMVGGELGLSDDKNSALLDWGQLSPKTGVDGWAASKLPAEAQEGLKHKAGWIPAPTGLDTLNDLAVLETKAGPVAVAVTMEGGNYEIQKTETARLLCLSHFYFSGMEDSDEVPQNCE